jgi:hypothetical protein
LIKVHRILLLTRLGQRNRNAAIARAPCAII